uniref:MyTH4 domain-containing protein n=1 Tax=Ornithorhynchus anatinus TaxID=9258 RepID=A0A6I8N2R1_ORNAN
MLPLCFHLPLSSVTLSVHTLSLSFLPNLLVSPQVPQPILLNLVHPSLQPRASNRRRIKGQGRRCGVSFPCGFPGEAPESWCVGRDSCQRGWRLLYILTAYYKCSEVLKPHLCRFLLDVCRSPGLHFQGIAKACEQNLRKTFQFGGRKEFPSSMELKAMVAGRSAKRQLFLLPGGIERHLKIKTCSVALDVTEEICREMALQRPEAFDEYVIFAVSNRGEARGGVREVETPPSPGHPKLPFSQQEQPSCGPRHLTPTWLLPHCRSVA